MCPYSCCMWCERSRFVVLTPRSITVLPDCSLKERFSSYKLIVLALLCWFTLTALISIFIRIKHVKYIFKKTTIYTHTDKGSDYFVNTQKHSADVSLRSWWSTTAQLLTTSSCLNEGRATEGRQFQDQEAVDAYVNTHRFCPATQSSPVELLAAASHIEGVGQNRYPVWVLDNPSTHALKTKNFCHRFTYFIKSSHEILSFSLLEKQPDESLIVIFRSV